MSIRGRVPLVPAQRADGPGRSGSRAIWSGIDAACSPAASLVIAAGLVRALGPKEYGFIVIALAVSGLSAAINPAIIATTTKFVSDANGRGAHSTEFARILTGSLIAVAAIGVFLIGVTFVLGRPLSNLVFGSAAAAAAPNVRTVLLLAVTSISVQQFDGVFAAALKGLEQFKRQAIMELCVRLVLAGAVTAIGRATRDARFVLAAYCCVCSASAILRGIVVMGCLDGQRLFSWPTRADFSKLLNFGGWMWLNAAATIAYSSVDRVLIGRVAGAAAAAEFNIYVQLAQLVHFLPASLLSFSYPVFSRLGAQLNSNRDAIRHLYRRYLIAASAIGSLLAFSILVSRHRLLYLVGGGAFRHEHDMAFSLLVFGFLILSLNVVPYCLCLGLGRPKSVSLITSASMMLSILLTAFLTPSMGILGAALARFAYGIGALALFFQAYRLLNSK
jgi:O-antigen/teichoic acid export membrane protein